MVSTGTKYWVSMHLSMHLIPPSLAGHFVNSDDKTRSLYRGSRNALHIALLALWML